jgi:hypothetical protein
MAPASATERSRSIRKPLIMTIRPRAQHAARGNFAPLLQPRGATPAPILARGAGRA